MHNGRCHVMLNNYKVRLECNADNPDTAHTELIRTHTPTVMSGLTRFRCEHKGLINVTHILNPRTLTYVSVEYVVASATTPAGASSHASTSSETGVTVILPLGIILWNVISFTHIIGESIAVSFLSLNCQDTHKSIRPGISNMLEIVLIVSQVLT